MHALSGPRSGQHVVRASERRLHVASKPVSHQRVCIGRHAGCGSDRWAGGGKGGLRRGHDAHSRPCAVLEARRALYDQLKHSTDCTSLTSQRQIAAAGRRTCTMNARAAYGIGSVRVRARQRVLGSQSGRREERGGGRAYLETGCAKAGCLEPSDSHLLPIQHRRQSNVHGRSRPGTMAARRRWAGWQAAGRRGGYTRIHGPGGGCDAGYFAV